MQINPKMRLFSVVIASLLMGLALTIPLENFEQKLQQEVPRKAANKPKQMSQPPIFVVDMLQPVLSYERNNTTRKEATVGGSLAPKLSYVRLMRVLMEHIWITAAEAAAAKGIPKLTNNTIM
ncbi:uncharacterized protein LOC117891806 [Drosophila subobscura]|uniref:uncharacterized protein LOC117891806 n=1 Tax=Drosophila subobscura TaxID=7241 RepID=UPI00155A07FE|nr:uncharacterized protein LOC117891806 [Drosophila subobscura]XP_034653379.1 uncharacterized protein LOC117891806 [Drosophila subobscura]